MTRRMAGRPVDDLGTTCTYEPQADSPGCTAAASLHVMAQDDRYGRVGLAACDQHADLARQAADIVQEHPYAPTCSDPLALWDPLANQCVMTGTGHPKMSVAALEARARAEEADRGKSDADLAGCTCGHDVKAHAHRTGRCGGKDSYGQPCACPSFEIDQEALELFRPGED